MNDKPKQLDKFIYKKKSEAEYHSYKYINGSMFHLIKVNCGLMPFTDGEFEEWFVKADKNT